MLDIMRLALCGAAMRARRRAGMLCILTRMMARMLPSRDIGLRRRVDRRLLLLPDHHLYVNLRLGACGRPTSER